MFAVARGVPAFGVSVLPPASAGQPSVTLCSFYGAAPDPIDAALCPRTVPDGASAAPAGLVDAFYDGTAATYRTGDVYPPPGGAGEPAAAPCAVDGFVPSTGGADAPAAPPPAPARRYGASEPVPSDAGALPYVERHVAANATLDGCERILLGARDAYAASWSAEAATCTVYFTLRPAGTVPMAPWSVALEPPLPAPSLVRIDRYAGPALAEPAPAGASFFAGCAGFASIARAFTVYPPYPVEQLAAAAAANGTRLFAISRAPGGGSPFLGILLASRDEAVAALADPLPRSACEGSPVASRWGPLPVGDPARVAAWRGRVVAPFAVYDAGARVDGCAGAGPCAYAASRRDLVAHEGVLYRRDWALDCGSRWGARDCPAASADPPAPSTCGISGCEPASPLPGRAGAAPNASADAYAEWAPGRFAAVACAGVPCYDALNVEGIAQCHPERGCFTTAEAPGAVPDFDFRLSAVERAAAGIPPGPPRAANASLSVPCYNQRTGDAAQCAVHCPVVAASPHSRPRVRVEVCAHGRRHRCGPDGCGAPLDADAYSVDDTAAVIPPSSAPAAPWPRNEGVDAAGLYRWVDASLGPVRSYLLCFRRSGELAGGRPVRCPEPGDYSYGCDAAGSCVRSALPRFVAAPRASAPPPADATRPCLDEASELARCAVGCTVEVSPGSYERAACPQGRTRYACDIRYGCLASAPRSSSASPDATLAGAEVLDPFDNPAIAVRTWDAAGAESVRLSTVRCVDGEGAVDECPRGTGYLYRCSATGRCERGDPIELGLYGPACPADPTRILDACGTCGGLGGDACGRCTGECGASSRVLRFTLLGPAYAGPEALRGEIARVAGASVTDFGVPTVARASPLPSTAYVPYLRAGSVVPVAVLNRANSTLFRGFVLVEVGADAPGGRAYTGGDAGALPTWAYGVAAAAFVLLALGAAVACSVLCRRRGAGRRKRE